MKPVKRTCPVCKKEINVTIVAESTMKITGHTRKEPIAFRFWPSLVKEIDVHCRGSWHEFPNDLTEEEKQRFDEWRKVLLS